MTDIFLYTLFFILHVANAFFWVYMFLKLLKKHYSNTNTVVKGGGEFSSSHALRPAMYLHNIADGVDQID